MDHTPAVLARRVGLTYGNGVESLAHVDLVARAGEITSIIGPSGCGKSTLLRIVAGLVRATAGDVEVGGEAPERQLRGRDGLALVFQEPRLLPWRGVAAQVALPLELLGEPVDHDAIARAIERVGLTAFARARPHELSGGMQMRVALARALVTRPRLLLLDEPFGALDEMTREQMGEQLLALQRSTGVSVLLVTHSVYEAVFLSHRVLVMSPRPGRIAGEVVVELPTDRDGAVRATPEFARLVGKTSAMLRGTSA